MLLGMSVSGTQTTRDLAHVQSSAYICLVYFLRNFLSIILISRECRIKTYKKMKETPYTV